MKVDTLHKFYSNTHVGRSGEEAYIRPQLYSLFCRFLFGNPDNVILGKKMLNFKHLKSEMFGVRMGCVCMGNSYCFNYGPITTHQWNHISPCSCLGCVRVEHSIRILPVCDTPHIYHLPV